MTLNPLQTAHTEVLNELERYKLLVDNIQDYAIFFMDENGYIQTWNKGAQKAKGYQASEIIGKHFSIFYTPEDVADKKPEQMLRIAKKIGRVEDEDWRVNKDGSRFWANVVITALYDNDGKVLGFAKVTRNLTERKEYEDNLREANTLLKKQQKELQNLNASKDEFISLASHQLRTPATAIKQLLGLLLEGFEGPLPNTIQGILEKTYEANERQIMIVNSLLRVAQIDAGKITLHKKKSDINEIVKSLCKEYEGVIRDKGQTLTCSLSSQPVYGYIDEHYYRTTLENILDNASKYTIGEGVITITTEQDRETATVTITDTGIGIPPQDIPSLFTKFYRITNDASHNVAGTGLGLYWCEKVIDLHEGTISVESEVGEGTSFKITVPSGEHDA